jgi:AcrR family transcriptional regulator
MAHDRLTVYLSEPTGFSSWRLYEAEYNLPPVLEAALDVFVRYGYHGTTVRQIAAQANLSVPGLYHHYKSKQDMLAILLDRSGEEVIRRATAARAEGGTEPRNRFIQQVHNIVLYMTHRQRLAYLQREMRSLEEKQLKRHLRLRDTLEKMMLEDIISAKALQLFDVDDPWSATRAVLTLCRGVADWYSPQGTSAPEEIAEQYVEFSLRLLGSGENTHPKSS